MFSITSNLYSLYTLQERLDKVSKEDAEGAVEQKKIMKERNASTLQLVQDTCDLLVPGHALGYIGGLDDGIVGLAGTLSSVIGVYNVWKKS